MIKFAIAGVFVERKLTGVTRYAWEIIQQLDSLIDPTKFEIELVVPKNVEVKAKYKNIKIVHYGNNIKFIWLNFIFINYIKKNKAIGIHLGVNVPRLRPDIVCIYDVNSIANPNFFSKYHYIKTKFEKNLSVKHGKKVFTISEFSAKEISKYLGGAKEDYPIIPCGWQHMEQIQVEGTSKTKFNIEQGSYFFSMSSIAPTKNFKWVIEAAKQNKDYLFIIAGGIDPKSFGISSLEEELPNVKYIGRITDKEAKILMRDSKAFIFPSYYEGFGIPPLEALACGARDIIVSDIPVMHEIFDKSVHYIAPLEYQNINLEDILNQKTSSFKNVLNNYSWRSSAKKLIDLLESVV